MIIYNDNNIIVDLFFTFYRHKAIRLNRIYYKVFVKAFCQQLMYKNRHFMDYYQVYVYILKNKIIFKQIR